MDECHRAQSHQQQQHAPVSKKLAAGEVLEAAPQMVRRSQVKRTPLGDATPSSDNQLETPLCTSDSVTLNL
jgi:hypothetical protein